MGIAFPELDFEAFHRSQLPARLADGRGRAAGAAARRLGSLGFRLREGGAWSYVPGDAGIELVPGDAAADTLIELSHASWQGLVHELEAAAGLLYAGRASCPRGDALRWVAWEPALRALYNGRPIYDPATIDLRDRHGAPLAPEQSFGPDGDAEDMAHFLRSAGYLVVRGVFSDAEMAELLAEADALRAEAVPGDKLSWWGRNARGEEVLCRVTRAAAKPRLRALAADPRVLRLVALASERLVQRGSARDEGVSVIYKNPEMTEGLSDIPWHRDCGMGGHAVMCPLLIVSVYLTPANAATGTLRFLPGSWNKGCGPVDADDARAPRGVVLDARAGDVTLHYGDTMHAAPPPLGRELARYRTSAVTAFARPGARPHRGRFYNEALHRRDDGQIEHLARVTEKATQARR